MMRGLSLCVLAVGCSLTLPGAAQDRGSESSDQADALGTHQQHMRFDIGARTQFVSNAGLDPFSENDVVPQLSLGASWVFWTQDRLSLAAAAGFDYGKLSSHARSTETSLDLARFTLGPEARYHLLPILALSVKVAPTLTRQSAEIATGAAGDQGKVAWQLGFDATAGAAVELYGYQSGESHRPRLWLAAEGGYGWTAPTTLSFKSDVAGAPQRLAPLELGELSLSGPLVRVVAALSIW